MFCENNVFKTQFMQKSRILMFIFLFISYFYKLFKGDYFFFILRSYKHNLFESFFNVPIRCSLPLSICTIFR